MLLGWFLIVDLEKVRGTREDVSVAVFVGPSTLALILRSCVFSAAAAAAARAPVPRTRFTCATGRDDAAGKGRLDGPPPHPAGATAGHRTVQRGGTAAAPGVVVCGVGVGVGCTCMCNMCVVVAFSH